MSSVIQRSKRIFLDHREGNNRSSICATVPESRRAEAPGGRQVRSAEHLSTPPSQEGFCSALKAGVRRQLSVPGKLGSREVHRKVGNYHL